MAVDNNLVLTNTHANPSGLIKEINTYFRENKLPLFIASYNKTKQNLVCEMTLPEEVDIEDSEANMKFNNLLRSYSSFGNNELV